LDSGLKLIRRKSLSKRFTGAAAEQQPPGREARGMKHGADYSMIQSNANLQDSTERAFELAFEAGIEIRVRASIPPAKLAFRVISCGIRAKL
jgi:hypothetical protein